MTVSLSLCSPGMPRRLLLLGARGPQRPRVQRLRHPLHDRPGQAGLRLAHRPRVRRLRPLRRHPRRHRPHGRAVHTRLEAREEVLPSRDLRQHSNRAAVKLRIKCLKFMFLRNTIASEKKKIRQVT